MLQAMISIAFFVAFSIYFFLGIYSLTINVKADLNRIFLILCMSIAVWAITFAAANSTEAYGEALLWRRASSLGWGSVYSILVHFTLVLTERRKILKTKWIYLALYLPAFFIVFFFGIYSPVADKQYELFKTAAGWGILPLQNIWYTLFDGYYISFSVAAFMLLYRWAKRTKDNVKKKHAFWLILSCGSAIVLGSFTDIFMNRLLQLSMPSVSPVFIMIPVVTIFIIIKKYGLLYPYKKNVFAAEGVILGDQTRQTFFRYISGMFVTGGMLNLLHYFLYSAQLLSVIIFSMLLVLLGAIIFLLPFLQYKRTVQDHILAAIIAFAIPLILLRFLEGYASNIVWPIPLIFMMITAVFNKRGILIMIAISGFATGIWSWLQVPKLAVQVGSVDYVSRIVLYGMGIMLTLYVNKIYLSRLAENEEQVRFQRMVSKISTDFITVTAFNLNYKVDEMLKRSARYYRADRSYLYLFTEDLKNLRAANVWYKEQKMANLAVGGEVSVTSYGWWIDQMTANKILFVLDGGELPKEAEEEKKTLAAKALLPVLFVPVANKDKVIGCIALGGVKKKKVLSEMDKEQLKVLANTLEDAISKVEAEKEINYLAYNDSLTGLPNRSLFKSRLEKAVDLARESERLIGVMLIDLDGFKEVNDTMGHDWGDYVLIQVSERLSHSIRKCDTVARFGGDEFLIMIPQADSAGTIQKSAEKIMETFKEPIFVQDQEFFITASCGIALFPHDGETVDALIKNADLAMYSAKNNGKNQYAFCSIEMKEEVQRKMMLTNSLYRALENHELELYYQPQINVETEEMIGIEALVRWNHPTLGRIPPSIFIPLAEQTGLITPIGTWVLKTACAQNKRWQNMGIKSVRIAVNVSIDQFRGGNLLTMVKKVLKETELDPRYLELEITEGIAMKEGDLIIKTLRELRSMGMEIAIDDFGMAYSSLSRLKELPVDRLKIDMLFVQGIAPQSKDKSIIEVIIHLARSLGIKVTAEGVETKQQLDFLAKAGCDDVQGYYYYKPMTAKDMESLLRKEVKSHLSSS